MSKMKKLENKRQTGCPVTFGLDTFGDKWTLLIIREMMLKGMKTYSDFLAADEGISTNILADRLKHLENEGVIEKARDPENGRSFTYSLTEKGYDLAPILLEIVTWSGKHDHGPNARTSVLKKIQNDREGYEAKLRSGKPG
ncbi:MAG: helix-turn-helix transcriptional regulator [Rhizobiaceae bacterium]|nr:helix-turn-helix transcriptional regulator [Rhizobiaceae bacterium]MBL4696617.1 helix-turn-helix transcriptional regulator [Rhizobiaceae bacterium]